MTNDIVSIDLNKWTTQQLAAMHHINAKTGKQGCSIQYISKCIKNGKIESYPIPELNLVLVERRY